MAVFRLEVRICVVGGVGGVGGVDVVFDLWVFVRIFGWQFLVGGEYIWMAVLG